MDDFRRRPSAVTCHSDSAAGSGVAVPHRSDRTLRLHHRTGRPVIAGLGTVAALSPRPSRTRAPSCRHAPGQRRERANPRRQGPTHASSQKRIPPWPRRCLPAKRQARPPPGNVHHLTNHPVDLYPGRVGGLRVVIWSCTEEAPGLLDCRISFAPTAFTRGAARDVSRQGIRSPPAPSSRPGRRVEVHAPLSVCRRARAWHG